MLDIFFSKNDYCGRILNGDYSRRLKKRVNGCIDTFNRLDQLGVPAMPYLAAWHEDENTIWYEYVSTQFARLLNCSSNEAATTIRDNVIARRIYNYSPADRKIREEVVTAHQLSDFRKELRRDSRSTGRIEAVYKVFISATRQAVWLKDLANIETFEQDRICLSLGTLTVVTKEMQAEEDREKLVHELQDALKNLKTLSGLLPICAECKKIRDDDGYWNQIETYISEHADVDFSHGICPDCASRFYQGLEQTRRSGKKYTFSTRHGES